MAFLERDVRSRGGGRIDSRGRCDDVERQPYQPDYCQRTDGNPPANGLGCSAHWFGAHPTFDNGGIVAMGYYEHGTRFLNVDKRGKISEVGYFMPIGGNTIATYWVSNKIVYSFDVQRGLDILEYSGSL